MLAMEGVSRWGEGKGCGVVNGWESWWEGECESIWSIDMWMELGDEEAGRACGPRLTRTWSQKVEAKYSGTLCVCHPVGYLQL